MKRCSLFLSRWNESIIRCGTFLNENGLGWEQVVQLSSIPIAALICRLTWFDRGVPVIFFASQHLKNIKNSLVFSVNGGSTSNLPPSSSLESTCSELALVPCMFVYAEFSLVHKFYAPCHSSFYMFSVIPFCVLCQMSAQNLFSFPLTFGVGNLDQLMLQEFHYSIDMAKEFHFMEMPT